MRFESFVNSERCKTDDVIDDTTNRLRALLIQKDVKLSYHWSDTQARLRALLIQKDVKQRHSFGQVKVCLRALLIQKDVKRSRLAVSHQ